MALAPVHAEQPWWHKYAMRADQIRFVKRRVCFWDPVTMAPMRNKKTNVKQSAKFPVCILVFNGDIHAAPIKTPVMMSQEQATQAQ